MNDENERNFLLAITVVFALMLAVVAIFCGGEFMKKMKIVSFIGIILFSIYFLIMVGIFMFSEPK